MKSTNYEALDFVIFSILLLFRLTLFQIFSLALCSYVPAVLFKPQFRS